MEDWVREIKKERERSMREGEIERDWEGGKEDRNRKVEIEIER